MPLSHTLPLFVALCLSAVAQPQTGLSVAGFGYRKPANTITAAPGQVLTVSSFGILKRIPEPVFPVATNGFPTEVEGVSVDIVQGPVTIQLQIRGIQQSACPTLRACSPATTLTIQIPDELSVDGSAQPGLRIKEGGATVAEIEVNPVTDSLHVINTCDQTGIFLSLADGVPAGSCVPMVIHARGPLVSASAPARPGETLILWAYGLGAIEHPISSTCCSTTDQLPLAVQPFNVSFSYTDAGRFPLRRLSQAVPTYVGMVGAGLYQVHFVVPDAPANISPCNRGSGNLRVLLSGPNSADGAEVCLQPFAPI
jgi:uncharacterized protein (TIGR03437 family)